MTDDLPREARHVSRDGRIVVLPPDPEQGAWSGSTRRHGPVPVSLPDPRSAGR